MKIDPYSTTLEHYTDLELLDIMESNHNAKQRMALAIILNQRADEERKVCGPSPGVDFLESGNKRKNKGLNPMPFLRSYSTRDLFTVISLTMMQISISQLNIYYSNEDEISPVLQIITLSIFILSFILNHVVYKIDHKTSNLFAGRVINSFILLTSFIFISTLHEVFTGGTRIIILEVNLSIIVSAILLIISFELVISFIQYLFRRLNWKLI